MITVLDGFVISFITSVVLLMVGLPVGMILLRKKTISPKGYLFLIYTTIVAGIMMVFSKPHFDFIPMWMAEAGFDFRFDQILLSLMSKTISSIEIYLDMKMLHALGVGGLILGCMFYAASCVGLFLLIRKSSLVRKVGYLNILRSSNVRSPFVLSYIKKSYILLPQTLEVEKQLERIAIKHEIQHIRHGDTKLIYILHLMRCLFWFNPLNIILTRHIQNIEEMGVDEALVYGKKVQYRKYMDTLWYYMAAENNERLNHNGYYLSHGILQGNLKQRLLNLKKPKAVRSNGLVLLGCLGLNVIIMAIMVSTIYLQHQEIKNIQADKRPNYLKQKFMVTFYPREVYDHPGIKIKTELGKEFSLPWLARVSDKKFYILESRKVIPIESPDVKINSYTDSWAKVIIYGRDHKQGRVISGVYDAPKFEIETTINYGEKKYIEELDVAVGIAPQFTIKNRYSAGGDINSKNNLNAENQTSQNKEKAVVQAQSHTESTTNIKSKSVGIVW